MKKNLKNRSPRSAAFKGRTLGLIHLGCPKNQVDSEEMLAAFAGGGWTLVGDPKDADVLVVNTCGFIDAAKEESMNAILEAVRMKRKGRCSKVVVAGCLAQRYAEQIAEDVPGVDAVVGLGQNNNLAEIVRQTFEGSRPVSVTPPPPEWQELGSRLMTTPPWTTYLKIGEGCNHRCSFCAIPSFRGDWRSRPAQFIVDEVRTLVSQGLKEAILIGQDTTLYGIESKGQWSLVSLVRELGQFQELKWQRIMYAHPGRMTDEIINLFGDVPNLAPYIDMPIQHGDDRTLKRMMRAGNSGRYLEVISKLRDIRPDIAIRSTFLVGFPGETDEEFNNTCNFLKQAELDRVGVFVYSHEDGTDAFQMESDVPKKVAEERASTLMGIQQEISTKRLSELVGTETEVLLEQQVKQNEWLGRTGREAPEVDGNVRVLAECVKLGDIIKAQIVSSTAHDLTALAV